MKARKLFLALSLAAALSSCIAQAQTAPPNTPTPLAATAPTAVPALVPFSGAALGNDDKPLAGEAGITFLIFSDETGGEPLFTETQTVDLGANGRYKVELGASLSSGLPINLFATGEARWLEVQIAGQTPQPRVLLASVPYALKSADAATLGGLPASAFVLAGSKEAAALTTAGVSLAATSNTASDVTTTGGASGYLAEFSGASSVVDSPLFVNGADVGIGTATPTATLDVNGTTILNGAVTVDGSSAIKGALTFEPTGTATASTSFDSQTLKLYTSAYNSSSNAVVQPRFVWQAEPTGNDTASPSGTLNLLSSTTSAAATETGFHFNANGTINFAPGQTFPGTGTGTITGVAAGTGLTGGGTTGNVTLNVDTTKVVTTVAAGTGLVGGGAGGNLALSVDPTQVPLLNAASNTFSGNVTVGGSLVAGTSNNTGGLVLPVSQNMVGFNHRSGTSLGATSYPLDMQAVSNGPTGNAIPQDFRWQAEPSLTSSDQVSGSLNLLYGASNGTPAETGFSLNASGQINAPNLFLAIAAGQQATPVLTIQADENGQARSAAQQLVIQGATAPGQQLLMGYVSDFGTVGSGGFATIQATWANVFNTPLMLQPNGGCVCIATGNNGYSNPLVVGQGQGSAIADGWATYSSRRFKTDIQTLPDALDKVEKLRGVSYTLKATGKREIGVIAEEVGAVVPEVVTYEANGKDARSVDYTRLTALLILGDHVKSGQT